MKTLSLLLFFTLTQTLFGQQNLVKFETVNGDNHPNISGELWFRNPNEIKTNTVSISENGKSKTLELTNPRKGDLTADNKMVIFLMTNPGPSKMKQFDWYRNVIGATLSESYIKPGDRIQIMSFNQQLQGQLLFPSSFNFTDQSEVLKKQLTDMYAVPYRSTCGGSRTLIWSAIDQVLDLIEKENPNLPVSIIVVSDDNSCGTPQANQTPVEKAKKLGVGIYAISRDDKNRFNSIEKICLETFGNYYLAVDNDLDAAMVQARKYMSEVNQRSAGQVFNFSYTTDYDNDGSSHPVTINMSGSTIETFIQMPEKNFLQWVKANWLVVTLIFLILILLIFFIVKNKKDSFQKQSEIEQRAQQEFQRIKADKERADAEMSQQIAEQDRQLNQIRVKAQQEEEAKRQSEKLKHADERKEILLQEMRMRGNLPWLMVIINGQEYRYNLDDPIFTIGRESDNNLCIPDTTISRKHAVIKYSNGEYTIQDLNSSNGVLINGQREKEIILMHGDVIQLGQCMLTFMI
jgi:hypothetical protein